MGKLVLLKLLAGVLVLGIACHATANSGSSPLAQLDSLTAKQIKTLKKYNIESLQKLSSLSSRQLSGLLRINRRIASAIVEEAAIEKQRLSRVYSRQRAKTNQINQAILNPNSRVRLPQQNAFAQLVAPTNECTILVRKVCGDQNQCPDSIGCPAAKRLLESFNGAPDTEERERLAETCVIALEDGVFFPACDG